MTLVPSLIFALVAPAAANHPAGTVLPGTATIDLTPGGLDALGDVVPALLPSQIDVPELGDSSSGTWGQCWLGGYEYSLTNAWVAIQVNDVVLVPRDGRLDLELDLSVQVNEASDPLVLYVEALCIGDDCQGYVEPFDATVTTSLGLQVVSGADGNPVLDATVGNLTLDYSLEGQDIQIDGCAIGTVEDVFNFFGLSLFDFVLSFAGQFINDLVGDFGPEIETLLEDAFSQASIVQSVDLNGVTGELRLVPGNVGITNAGVRIAMDGSFNVAETASCVAQWDPGGSLDTPSDPPAIGAAGAGMAGDHHLGLHLSDDFANQALYSLWRGGLLCYAVDEELTGFPLDTTILRLLAGDAFSDLFPESKPLVINTRPQAPPTVVYNGDHDLGVDIDQLGLDFFAELDDREALIVGLDLAADAGVDLTFDGTTGNLAVGVALSGEDVVPTVVTNEFKPGTEGDIESNFAGVFDTLVGGIISGLVGDLAFALPAIEGLGLTDLALAPAGDQEDWLGAYAKVGIVPYTGAGCGEGGGCEGGCATPGRAGGQLALFAFPLALVALRRRRA